MYAKIDNGIITQYPVQRIDIQAAFPESSLPDPLTPGDLTYLGYVAVQPVDAPAHDPLTQYVSELTPLLTNGVWTQQWQVSLLDTTVADANLVAAKSQRWRDIQTLRDFKKLNGGFPVGTKWFHSDVFSRSQQLGLILMGTNIPVGLTWKTMDGSYVDMTPTLAQQILASGATQDTLLFSHADSLRAAVNAATDPLSVDITAGWPATYVG